MLFIIHALDRPDALPTRLARYDDHRAYLSDAPAHGVEIVMSGPLVADDGETMIGSLFLIDAPDRESVMRFHAQDPFRRAEIWREVTISAFIRRRG